MSDCKCPLCGEAGAQVKGDKNGRLYLVCDFCVSMLRTSSRMGQEKLRALVRAAGAPVPTPEKPEPVHTEPEKPEPVPKPAPAPKPEPAPAPKPKKREWWE